VWTAPRYGWDSNGYHFCGQGTYVGFSYDNTACATLPADGKATSGDLLFYDHWTDCLVASWLSDCVTFRMGEYFTKSGGSHG
jgi:hypothetical protein